MLHQQVSEHPARDQALARSLFHEAIAQSLGRTARSLHAAGNTGLEGEYTQQAWQAWQNARAIEQEWADE